MNNAKFSVTLLHSVGGIKRNMDAIARNIKRRKTFSE